MHFQSTVSKCVNTLDTNNAPGKSNQEVSGFSSTTVGSLLLLLLSAAFMLRSHASAKPWMRSSSQYVSAMQRDRISVFKTPKFGQFPDLVIASWTLRQTCAGSSEHAQLSCTGLGALGDERHLLLECPAMRPVRQRFAHLFAKTDTMQMFIRQQDLFSVACYICALSCQAT